MTIRSVTLALATTLLFGGPALADGTLRPDRQAKVEAVLRQEGFTRWKEIELDDGVIEVDDAVDAFGKSVDLKLDPATLAIVARKAE